MPDPEWQFVINACAPTPRTPDPGAIPNWARVNAIALQQRVFPRLFASASELIPPEYGAALQALIRQNARAALANVARTVTVTRLLAEAGVETIVLKGPLLARQLYGDLAARVSGDVDLLVPESQLLRAARTLAEAGYLHHTPISAEALRRLRKSEHDIAFAHPEDQILVELHADIAQPHYGYRVDLGCWWGERRQTMVGEADLRVLSPEHAYLLSALHAAKHRWHRLDLVSDLAAYARLALNRAQIREEASRAWLLRLIETGEAMVAAVFGGTPPDSGLVAEAMSQMTEAEELGRWDGVWFDLRLRERWRDKAHYLRKRLISAKLAL